MISNRRTVRGVLQWSTGAGLAAAAMIGMGTAQADTPDDVVGQTLAAASSGNQYDPAVFAYSSDPSNLFSPVYSIQPVGPEDVQVTTDATGAVYGTQDFSLSSLGIPVDTFTGNVEYTPLSGTGLSFIAGELGGYTETITTLGSPGTLLPESTAFLVDEFGLGYGNVFEESMNSAGTSATVGDFVLTPFGDKNITPIVDLFLPKGVGINDVAGAAPDLAASASSASATPDDVIGQAITDLNQSTTLLDTASTADLGTRAAVLLSNSEALPTQVDPGLTQLASLQDQLSASDQTSLAGVDEQLVTAAQNLLTADQGFIAADQAGELSGNGLTSADWTLLGADLHVLGSAIHASGATLFDAFTGGLDTTSSAADIASSLDPATAVDPSIFADLFSSIGL